MAKKRNNKKGGNARRKANNANSPLTTPQETGNVPTSNKAVCKFLLEGRCKRGDACAYAHSPEACAEGARVIAIRDGKSPEDAEMAASVAFQVAERKMFMKEEEKAAEAAALEAVAKEINGIGGGGDAPSEDASKVETKIEQKQQPPQPKKEAPKKEASLLPPGLESSLSQFTPAQQELAKSLCHLPGSTHQRHLFDNWSTSPSDNTKKKVFMAKLESIDKSYPAGGLVGYLQNAVSLLEKSRRGENPLEGWVPSVPKGEAFEIGTEAFLGTEKMGLEEVGKCGFVLVAGGLGERLGYSDIKIGLPTELATETSYIQFYIETILAFQSRYAPPGQKLPLCIMTSGDTNDKTVALLKTNNYFGMTKDQITIVQQGMGVPALNDNDAHIAMDSNDPYDIQMKPHGHGDIHALLHSHGVAKSWLDKGVQWMVFFQDTNGLAFHTLALSLGVSSKMGLIMNSITCPRKAKQAIGAITKLTKGNEQRTINVEYNQLDPLLRATGYPDGDVNDETGLSPFPGNINQLLFRLDAYVKVLERTKGVMPEFVNPKYKDADKSVFKKPTRLECMMQDFPIVLEGSETEKVGFTSLASELCFSPVKNATADGEALQKNGTHPGVAATGEADQNGAIRQILRSIGCNVEDGFEATFSGIKIVSGPDCVLKPSFAACANEFKKKFPNPSAVKISGKSSLVLSGEGLVIESLDLDGALVVDCEEGATGVIRNLTVENKGWVKVLDESSKNEVIRMRGYHINKLETEKIVFKKDGSIEGNYPPDIKTVKTQSSAPKESPKADPTPAREVKSAPKESPKAVGTPAPVPTPRAAAPPTDLSQPASEESKESDQFCGGACTIL